LLGERALADAGLSVNEQQDRARGLRDLDNDCDRDCDEVTQRRTTMVSIPAIAPYRLPTSTDLPHNVASWVPDPCRATLLVHDMQRYFLRPFPPELKKQLVGNAATLRDRCRALKIPVAYTTQPGAMTDEQRGLLRDFWGPGMRLDPTDQGVTSALVPEPNDRVFTKWRYSAFFRSDLLAWLRELGRDQLIICGVYAHVGVLVSAVDAFTNDIQPFLVADAIGDLSVTYHRWSLEYAAHCCAVVTTAEKVLT
jgi:isochorismate hydrolase